MDKHQKHCRFNDGFVCSCVKMAEIQEALCDDVDFEEVEKSGVIENPMRVAAQQAEDESLWFTPQHITEHILQNALRRLAAAVEGEKYFGNKAQKS